MAFNLSAILRLDTTQFSRSAERAQRTMERAERQTRHWRDSNGRLRDSLGRFSTDADRASRAADRFSRSASGGKSGFSGAIRGLGGLTTAIGGVVGAYAAISGAKSIFENTVGEAMKYEQSSAVIGAIINDKKKTEDYLKLVNDFSVDSPIMNSQDMMMNSKSFLTATPEKDMGQLKQMWSLAERMAAIDPAQGVEGAVFALREMFSGDAISMVRRFEMPKKIMNEIKKMDVKDQLVALDDYFNKIGMTQKLIDEMAGTSLGIWAQVSEKFQILLRTMGEPSLKVVSGFLTGILEKLENGEGERFAKVGARWIKGILTGLTNGAMSIYEWFNALTLSEEFKKKSTVTSKIIFVFDDAMERFKTWIKGDGEKDIQKSAEAVIELISGFLLAAQDPIVEAALTIGKSIGGALVTGISDELKKFAFDKLDNSILYKYGTGKAIKEGVHLGANFYEWVTGGDEKKKEKKKKSPSSKANKSVSGAPTRAFNGGTDRIHRDGLYYLHKSEAVLNRGKADKYRQAKSEGEPQEFPRFTPQRNARPAAVQQQIVVAPSKAVKGNGGVTINIAKVFDKITIREEADIDRIMSKMVERIAAAGEAGAGAGMNWG